VLLFHNRAIDARVIPDIDNTGRHDGYETYNTRLVFC